MKAIDKVGIVALATFIMMLLLRTSNLEVSFPGPAWIIFGIAAALEIINVSLDMVKETIERLTKSPQ